MPSSDDKTVITLHPPVPEEPSAPPADEAASLDDVLGLGTPSPAEPVPTLDEPGSHDEPAPHEPLPPEPALHEPAPEDERTIVMPKAPPAPSTAAPVETSHEQVPAASAPTAPATLPDDFGQDDERTVVMPARPAAPQPTLPITIPGDAMRTVAPTAPPTAGGGSAHTLPIGTRIGEFEITRLIGEGGFGIVYLAQDTLLDRRVALKEYMPSALATRGFGTEVTVKSERHAETFQAGMRSFINEAKLLAQFDHQSLVKVYRFWEANGTAYMVMPFYEGMTLKDALRESGKAPDETWLRNLLAPLVEALAVLHGAQCFHRDIAPDNIMLLQGSGRPLLLDFGAARRVIGDMTQALTVILKPGYAPVEQYAEVPSMKQGPWTDIYALAAVIYFAILGKTPPAAVGRLMNDTYQPLATEAAGRYSDGFLRAIDRALSVQPQDRPQDVAELADDLGLALGARDTSSGAAAPAAQTAPAAPRTQRGTSAPGRATPTAPASKTPASNAKAGGKKTPVLIAAGVGGIALIAGVTWFVTKPSGTPPHPQSSPGQTQVVASPGTNPTAPTAASAVQPAPVAEQTPPASLPAYTPAGEFDRIVTLADPSFQVSALPHSTVAHINKDRLQFEVGSARAGYVYVFMVDPEGQYLLLFPSTLDHANKIAAGQILSLPRATWPMQAGAPAGANRFLVLVSAAPRSFDDAGLHHDAPFSSFPEAARQSAAAQRTATYSPFAGKPACAAGTADCTSSFGASAFTIDVVE